ncbi:MAG: sugar ABC transporter substrate-binding protein [Acidimicrobiia bacterium]|nr:sugar ABC transporter substrate-binding protein [Acidimicrobiia bacterium]MYC45872.1 sugar ABC transporter substrate-binding protein [Acidimicrobiia bacterium]
MKLFRRRGSALGLVLLAVLGLIAASCAADTSDIEASADAAMSAAQGAATDAGVAIADAGAASADAAAASAEAGAATADAAAADAAAAAASADAAAALAAAEAAQAAADLAQATAEGNEAAAAAAEAALASAQAAADAAAAEASAAREEAASAQSEAQAAQAEARAAQAEADAARADAEAAQAEAASAQAEAEAALEATARPFEGVTLKFGKAPHGADEIALFETWLAPFEERTGITVEHTVVPWGDVESTYTASFAGDDPFDVTYQVSTHLTLFGDRGAFMDVLPLMSAPEYASERAHFIDSAIDASLYQGKLYGVPIIIGSTVMFVNLDLLEQAGVSEIPSTTDELIAAAQAVEANTDAIGFHVPMTTVDFNWYFNLQNVHNFGGDIVSDDYTSATIDSEAVRAATQFGADLICTHGVQPPIGQYNREEGISLFKGGQLAMLLDEPLRVTAFEDEGLPFDWDIAPPVGAPDGTQTMFSTTGHWSVAAESSNPEAAWELAKFLSSAEFMTAYNEVYGWISPRDDITTFLGNEKLQRNLEWVLASWDGLVTHPNIAQILDEYGQALEAAASCEVSVDDALSEAQARAAEILERG